MEILPDTEIIDLALWLRREQTLIVSDFHLGYEGMLKNKGILVPSFQLKDVIKRLENILKEVKPKMIIVNGDLKHEFGKILNQEWRDVLKVVDFLSKHCEELVLVRGNHDHILAPIANKRKIRVVEDFLIKDIFITHGDKIKPTKAKTIIIGHEHPAIKLSDNQKTEKYECFLKSRQGNKTIIVIPSFNPLTKGTNVLEKTNFSPYLKDIPDFKIYVVGDKIYDFGRYKNLSRHQNKLKT